MALALGPLDQVPAWPQVDQGQNGLALGPGLLILGHGHGNAHGIPVISGSFLVHFNKEPVDLVRVEAGPRTETPILRSGRGQSR